MIGTLKNIITHYKQNVHGLFTNYSDLYPLAI